MLRYTGRSIEFDGPTVHVEAGAVLQDLVDASIEHGLKGLETMTGIPGWVGGAVYGNAGAYGHSINERVTCVRFFDGAAIREMGNAECEFRYRESAFKRHKDWVILSAGLRLEPADTQDLRAHAESILKIIVCPATIVGDDPVVDSCHGNCSAKLTSQQRDMALAS